MATLPPPPPTPLPVVTAEPAWTAPAGAEAVASVARAVGWPEYAIPAVIDVTRCESGWDMGVVGAAGEIGWFQIHPVNWADAGALGFNIWDPYGNAGYALVMWQRAGWQPWSCAR